MFDARSNGIGSEGVCCLFRSRRVSTHHPPSPGRSHINSLVSVFLGRATSTGLQRGGGILRTPGGSNLLVPGAYINKIVIEKLSPAVVYSRGVVCYVRVVCTRSSTV